MSNAIDWNEKRLTQLKKTLGRGAIHYADWRKDGGIAQCYRWQSASLGATQTFSAEQSKNRQISPQTPPQETSCHPAFRTRRPAAKISIA